MVGGFNKTLQIAANKNLLSSVESKSGLCGTYDKVYQFHRTCIVIVNFQELRHVPLFSYIFNSSFTYWYINSSKNVQVNIKEKIILFSKLSNV